MKSISVSGCYKQFYVADIDINPLAPEVWTDDNVAQRHNCGQGIVALSPDNEIKARVNIFWFDDKPPITKYDFLIEARLNVTGKNIGVLGWPWELQDSQEVIPGEYVITFSGHCIDRIDNNDDYYVVWIHRCTDLTSRCTGADNG